MHPTNKFLFLNCHVNKICQHPSGLCFFLSKWQACTLVSRMEWIFSQASFFSSPQMNLYPFFRRLEIGFVTSARSGKKWLSCCRAPNSDHTSFTDVGGDKCFRAVILPWFGETPPSLTTYPQYPTLRSITIFAWLNFMFLFP